VSHITALAHASEVVNEIPGKPWMYGITAFAILLVLLFLVSRLNNDR
jgi:hypothetical protein